MKIDIYGTPACGVCKQVKSYLESEGTQYTYKTVGDDITIDDLSTMLGRTPRAVPVILIDDVELSFKTLKERVQTAKTLGSITL